VEVFKKYSLARAPFGSLIALQFALNYWFDSG